jgi:hypothetical protein
MTEKQGWFARFLLTVGLDLPGIIAFFKSFLKDGIDEKRKKNPRPDVVKTILALKDTKPEKAKILMDRLEEASKSAKPDFENELVLALGGVIPYNEEGKNIKEDVAIQIYEEIADLSPEEFAVFVYIMKHDPIWQMVKYFLQRYGLGGLKSLAGFLLEAGEYGYQELGELSNRVNKKLQPRLEKLEKRAAKKGVKAWFDF